jgi:16S rRNA (cytidine1402-2'-O)-methyltransferase
MPLAVCATPIGNMDDVTLRVLRELAAADVVLCEDTRHTRGLLDRHGIDAKLLSYHEHNEAKRVAELLPRLEVGEHMALVSDAGLPGVSDPGARLIAAALEAGVPVTVLPGPSAVETALVASGLVEGRYQFVGFLPRAAAGGAVDGAGRLAVPGGRVRGAAATPPDAGVARPRAAGAACRGLPRADEALRGSRARIGVRAGGALR